MATLSGEWTTITSEYSCDKCGRDNVSEVTLYSNSEAPILCTDCALEWEAERGAELLEGAPNIMPQDATADDEEVPSCRVCFRVHSPEPQVESFYCYRCRCGDCHCKCDQPLIA